MSIIFPLLFIGIFTGIVLVAILVKSRLRGDLVATFTARVKDIQRTTTWISSGLLLPITSTTLVLEDNHEVKVNEWDARHVHIGDRIWVSQYSAGQYRFHTLAE